MKYKILVLDDVNPKPFEYRRDEDMDYVFVKDTETAIGQLQEVPYDLLLIADTTTETDERKLRKLARIFTGNIRVLKARTSPLPLASINQMIAGKRREERTRYVFVDNALKNASFNIIIQ